MWCDVCVSVVHRWAHLDTICPLICMHAYRSWSSSCQTLHAEEDGGQAASPWQSSHSHTYTFGRFNPPICFNSLFSGCRKKQNHPEEQKANPASLTASFISNPALTPPPTTAIQIPKCSKLHKLISPGLMNILWFNRYAIQSRRLKLQTKPSHWWRITVDQHIFTTFWKK